jgi:uncharacterized DUF497 family protein
VFEWNPKKAESNLRKHGVPFRKVEEFDWNTAAIRYDDDMDYGEDRLVATGFIGMEIYVLIYVERDEATRVISLRKATKQEIRSYEEQI